MVPLLSSFRQNGFLYLNPILIDSPIQVWVSAAILLKSGGRGGLNSIDLLNKYGGSVLTNLSSINKLLDLEGIFLDKTSVLVYI